MDSQNNKINEPCRKTTNLVKKSTTNLVKKSTTLTFSIMDSVP